MRLLLVAAIMIVAFLHDAWADPAKINIEQSNASRIQKTSGPAADSCKTAELSSEIQKSLKNKNILFIGENHNKSPLLTSETIVHHSICQAGRPVKILTEFIWPSWQKDLDLMMTDNQSEPQELVRRFIDENVRPTRYAYQDYKNRFPEFLLWVKGQKIPLLGIDLDDFGRNQPDPRNALVPQVMLETVAKKYQISSYMIDPVTDRDLNMARQILDQHKRAGDDTLLVVYLGSNHAEKLPTLLAPHISLDKMLVVHLGAKEMTIQEGGRYKTVKLEGKMRQVQKTLSRSNQSAEVMYMYPYPEINELIAYAKAAQSIIYESKIWYDLSPSN